MSSNVRGGVMATHNLSFLHHPEGIIVKCDCNTEIALDAKAFTLNEATVALANHRMQSAFNNQKDRLDDDGVVRSVPKECE
jgi:hypothetical protein